MRIPDLKSGKTSKLRNVRGCKSRKYLIFQSLLCIYFIHHLYDIVERDEMTLVLPNPLEINILKLLLVTDIIGKGIVIMGFSNEGMWVSSLIKKDGKALQMSDTQSCLTLLCISLSVVQVLN